MSLLEQEPQSIDQSYPKYKTCCKCRADKETCLFSKSRSTKDGLQGLCKNCQKLWREENREANRRYHMDHSLLRWYGLSVKDFNRLTEEQGNKCASCGLSKLNKHGRLSVDHDHSTGKVRALLCTGCNSALGLANENPAVLRALADYIEHHKSISSGVPETAEEMRVFNRERLARELKPNRPRRTGRPIGRTNTSGTKGVYFSKANNNWVAEYSIKGKHFNMGRFATKELAGAYRVANLPTEATNPAASHHLGT